MQSDLAPSKYPLDSGRVLSLPLRLLLPLILFEIIGTGQRSRDAMTRSAPRPVAGMALVAAVAALLSQVGGARAAGGADLSILSTEISTLTIFLIALIVFSLILSKGNKMITHAVRTKRHYRRVVHHIQVREERAGGRWVWLGEMGVDFMMDLGGDGPGEGG